MNVVTRGLARIQHAATGEIYEISPAELDWQQVGGEEREMGPEITYSAALSHTDLGDLTWWMFEYPVGAFNDRETDVAPHNLLQDFDLSFGDFAEPEDSEDDGDADDRDAAEQARVDALVEWFFQNYEDPAESTPYISAEGGYQWIHGGPYDAREELQDNYPNEDEAIIDAAVDEIESDGLTDWAPRNPLREDEGDQPEEVSPGSHRCEHPHPADRSLAHRARPRTGVRQA